MKKISILSGLMLTALIAFTAFTTSPPASNPAEKLVVHVIGCETCRNIQYCINGGPVQTATTSDFVIECNPQLPFIQIICIKCCPDNRFGTATFDCGITKEVTIKVSPDASECSCFGNKKK
ncbi:MAG: hypothetical protein PHN88_10280 [Ignavibacteria bacterium]|nr:hypothetical protein [Ignavibacteria bacterium]